MSKKALIIVDVQNDFCPGGSLAVPEGDEIVPGILAIRDTFDLVIFTKDWHPADHCSFVENGGIWPAHCVQQSHGARLHKDLKAQWDHGDFVLLKGLDVSCDSYSAFIDEGRQDTGLDFTLKEFNIKDVYVCGLALDYCVKATALDSVKYGYNTFVFHKLCRGVDEQTSLDAMKEMGDAGICFIENDH